MAGVFAKISPEEYEHHFRLFLSRLDPSPEAAALAYGRLHRKLQIFFEGRAGSAVNAAELADATIDRAARKLAEDPVFLPGNLPAYVLKIAGFIYLEHLKLKRDAPLDNDPVDPASLRPADPGLEPRLTCLQRCLTHLSQEDYQLVLSYYARDKSEKIVSRRKTAAALNKSGVALRVQVFRIRRSLERCITRCLKSLGEVTEPGCAPPINRSTPPRS